MPADDHYPNLGRRITRPAVSLSSTLHGLPLKCLNKRFEGNIMIVFIPVRRLARSDRHPLPATD